MFFNNFNKLSDLANRIMMSQKSKLSYVFLPYSKFILSIIKVLKIKGFIKNIFILYSKFKIIIIKLKYFYKTPNINYFKFINKFKNKTHIKHKNMHNYTNKSWTSIFTTQKGVFSGEDCLNLGIGGNLICNVF